MTAVTVVLVALAAYFGVVGWLTFGRGPFRFVYNPFVAPIVRRVHADGTTIGARCYVARPDLLVGFPNGLEPLTRGTPEHKWFCHERQHNRQWRVRPFMGPVYFAWEFTVGYKLNPLEAEALREEAKG